MMQYAGTANEMSSVFGFCLFSILLLSFGLLFIVGVVYSLAIGMTTSGSKRVTDAYFNCFIMYIIRHTEDFLSA